LGHIIRLMLSAHHLCGYSCSDSEAAIKTL
jgi:hypothetical protein